MKRPTGDPGGTAFCGERPIDRRKLKKDLSDIQGLIGEARGAFMNDRDPMRADKVLGALEKAFELILRVRTPFGA